MSDFVNDQYIIKFDNVLSEKICNNLILKYNYVLNNDKEKIDKLSICYKNGKKLCGACNCTRINLMQHEIFSDEVYSVAHITNDLFTRYKKEVGAFKNQFPEKFEFESLKIKRYMPNSEEQFKPHIDVDSWEMAKRFIGVIYYLNDNFVGGETNFIKQNLKVKPKMGSCLFFPPYWPWIHSAEKIISGDPKYFLGTYLTYES